MGGLQLLRSAGERQTRKWPGNKPSTRLWMKPISSFGLVRLAFRRISVYSSWEIQVSALRSRWVYSVGYQGSGELNPVIVSLLKLRRKRERDLFRAQIFRCRILSNLWYSRSYYSEYWARNYLAVYGIRILFFSRVCCILIHADTLLHFGEKK